MRSFIAPLVAATVALFPMSAPVTAQTAQEQDYPVINCTYKMAHFMRLNEASQFTARIRQEYGYTFVKVYALYVDLIILEGHEAKVTPLHLPEIAAKFQKMYCLNIAVRMSILQLDGTIRPVMGYNPRISKFYAE